MNTTSHYWGYITGVGAILFSALGFFTGWISPSEALTVFTIGASALGIHVNMVAMGRAMGAIR